MERIDVAVTVRLGMPGTISLREEDGAVKGEIEKSSLFTSVRWMGNGLACFFVRDEAIPLGIFEAGISSLFSEMGLTCRVLTKESGGE